MSGFFDFFRSFLPSIRLWRRQGYPLKSPFGGVFIAIVYPLILFGLSQISTCFQSDQTNAKLDRNNETSGDIAQTQDAHTELLTEILTSVKDASEAKKAEVVNNVVGIEEGYRDQLEASFDLGYALMFVEEKDYYFVPRHPLLQVDWLSTKIISNTENMIEILLPSVETKNGQIYKGNIAGVVRGPYNTMPVTTLGVGQLFAMYLGTVEGGDVIVVGIRTTPDDW